MSLDLINHKLTTSTTDENGVITWSNPAVKETINSKGEVFNQYGEKRAKSVVGKYSITICGLNYGYPASFNSIYSRMVLGVKLRSNTLKKKSDEVGYLPENMEVISTTKAYLAGKNFKTKGNVLHTKSKPIHKEIIKLKQENRNIGDKIKSLYRNISTNALKPIDCSETAGYTYNDRVMRDYTTIDYLEKLQMINSMLINKHRSKVKSLRSELQELKKELNVLGDIKGEVK